jgi:transposase-like protein
MLIGIVSYRIVSILYCMCGSSPYVLLLLLLLFLSLSLSLSLQASAAAAGLPEFLWGTQQPKRKRDPSAPKLKRQRYTKQHKEMVLSSLRGTPGSKLPEIAKQYNIPEGTLRGWYDEERRTKAGTAPLDDLGEINEQILDPPPEEDDSVPKKKKRQRYSNETKIQVILALETRQNVSLNDVAKEFNVAAGTVRGWREEADKIQKQAMENRRVGAKANPSRDPLRKVWDAILNLFENNSRLPLAQRLEVNVAVVRTIGKQARDVLLEAHHDPEQPQILSPTELVNMEKFKASETWARKWARDHQVISSKPESVTQAELAQTRVAELQKIVADYPTEHVYTMTATGLFYRILPHRTYVSKMATQRRVRACKGLKSKDRMTLYLCCNEAGTDKLPITCIGKYENPACFRVAAQKVLPYLQQKQAQSDAGTFQMWWRTVFLPHIRNQFEDGEKCLLLVETLGPCKANLLKDPTDQVRVEALPPSTSSTMMYANPTSKEGSTPPTQPSLPQCQAMEYGILETIKRRYRYRLLQEVMDAFDERWQRREVADNAEFPTPSRGLREGDLAHIGDSMRLLNAIWQEVATTTIAKSWQRTKLRPKSKDDPPHVPTGQRAKSEKRQTTREKKQLIKDLNFFLTKHESKDFTKDGGANHLEEMVEKLKNCFLYTDGEVIETKEMVESLEEWIGLEDSQGMISLFMEEIKQEMNIDYLVGLKEPIEGVVPEAEEGEDVELEPEKVEQANKKDEELQLQTAIELATTIKSTACKLFEHGNILGELAVRLDEAADSVFRLLRKQRQAAQAKKEVEKAKANAKKVAATVVSNLDSAPEEGEGEEDVDPAEEDVDPAEEDVDPAEEDVDPAEEDEVLGTDDIPADIPAVDLPVELEDDDAETMEIANV